MLVFALARRLLLARTAAGDSQYDDGDDERQTIQQQLVEDAGGTVSEQ